MKHLGTKTLDTPRLILRQFVIDDCELFYKNWASDERVTKYMTWDAHQNIELTKIIVTDWVNNYVNDNFYQWAIVLKETNEPIGSISVVRMDEETETFEIGYCLSYDYWNKGITSEAFKAVIKYAFEEIKIKVFAARHDERNIASGKVMEKCGLKYIGTKEDINKVENIILKMYELKNN